MKAAHVYAEKLRWAVVPLHDVAGGACSCGKSDCPSGGKHPRLRQWQDLATADLATVQGWQAQFPSGNIGIATGSISGFFALDVDPDKGGDETLDALLREHGALPPTVTAQTGSGGRHYLFRLPPGLDLRNSAHKLGRGLDTRGDGGQIVVAPSVSARGKSEAKRS